MMQTSFSNETIFNKEVHLYILLRLFIERKAFMTSYLDEVIYFKEVDISYKDCTLKSKPLP